MAFRYNGIKLPLATMRSIFSALFATAYRLLKQPIFLYNQSTIRRRGASLVIRAKQDWTSAFWEQKISEVNIEKNSTSLLLTPNYKIA